MATWRVDIERKTLDVVIVDAETFEEALAKGQKSIFQIREKGEIKAVAIEWPQKPAIDRFVRDEAASP